MHKSITYPIHILLVSILWICLSHFEQTPTTPIVSASDNQQGEIAFTVDNDGSSKIALISPDGSNIQQLNVADASWATFSPDKKQFAFQSNRNSKWQIFLANADGSSERVLSDGASPAWSPDGKHIAFLTIDNSGALGVSVIDADGSNLKTITPTKTPDKTTKTTFAWSPDGKNVSFTLPANHGMQLYSINVDGSSQRPLTTLGDNYWSTWSPDGNQIAFSSYVGGISVIYVMNADGSNSRQVSSGNIGDAWYPSWSPDGKTIAFISNWLVGQSHIYLIETADTSQSILVSVDFPINGNAVWSPDGKQIAFVSSPDGKSESLYVVDTFGNQEPREIADHVLGSHIEWLH